MKIYIKHAVLFISVILIGILDVLVGNQFSIKALFVIPLYAYISYFSISLILNIIFAIFVSLAWSFSDFYLFNTNNYSILAFNLFTRMASMIVLTFLIYKFSLQRKQLKTINEQLLRSIQEKNELLGMAAHDLRSPISNIFSFAELLLYVDSNSLTSNQSKYVKTIHKASCKMIELLNETLNYTKIESGTLLLKKQPYEFITTLNEITDDLQVFAKRKSVLIKLESSENAIMLNFDRLRVGQVVENLILNAIKYSKSNTQINIVVKKNKNEVLTNIIDQGIGIRDDEIGNIFKPFVKTSSMPTWGESSSGIGLAIVKKMVEAHGGSVFVESNVNVGSTFSFTLPL